MEICDALMRLDAENDEQWTTKGQAQVPAVAAILGREVSRAEINEAAPGFTRAVHREALAAVAEQAADAGGVVLTEADAQADLNDEPRPDNPTVEPPPAPPAPPQPSDQAAAAEQPDGPPRRTWLYHKDKPDGQIFTGADIEAKLAEGWKHRKQDI